MWRWTEIDVTLSPVLTASRIKECLMTFIAVRCPHCQSDQIVKRGKTGCGTHRYLCQNPTCATGSFLLDYRYLGRLPEVKHQIIDMSLNASGVRDTARVLRISTDTVLRELRKKEPALVVACDRSSDGSRLSVCLWAPQRRSLFAAQSAAGALWAHAFLYGSLGGVRTPSRPRHA